MVRVIVPSPLRALAGVPDAVSLSVEGPVTPRRVLDALEARYPALCGTIRDHATKERRPLVRYFACSEDWSHEPIDAPLPEAVANGAEPFLVIASIAGGASSGVLTAAR